MKDRFHSLLMAAVVGVSLGLALNAPAQSTTAFTYQGNLVHGGAAVTGLYDFQFGLYSTNSGGAAVLTVTNLAVPVTNGLFTTGIDFGNSFNGASYYLDIAVRTNGGAGFAELSGRQAITPAPYALYAPSSGTVTGTISVTNLPASVALLNSNQVFTGTISATGFSGDGSGLTNLPGAIGSSYLYAYSTISQVAAVNTFQNVTFIGANSQANGWNPSPLGPNVDYFTANSSGLFMVQYQAEVTGTASRTVSMHALTNGVEVVGSQAAVTLGTNSTTAATLLSQFFLIRANTNDLFRLQLLADGSSASLTPSGSGTTRPSVTLSIVRIGQ